MMTTLLLHRQVVCVLVLLLMCGRVVAEPKKKNDCVKSDIIDFINTTKNASAVAITAAFPRVAASNRWQWLSWWKKEHHQPLWRQQGEDTTHQLEEVWVDLNATAVETLSSATTAPSSRLKWFPWWKNDGVDLSIRIPRKRSKRSFKTGKQKMANCRHLASMPGAGTWSFRARAVWRRFFPNKRQQQLQSVAASSATPAVFSAKDMNVAYGMAVAATLAYWDFHKKPLPDNRTYYEVVSLKEGSPQPLSRYRKRVRSVISTLKEAQPWLSPLLATRSRSKKDKAVSTSVVTTSNLTSGANTTASSNRWTQWGEARYSTYRNKWRNWRDKYATRKKHQIQLEYSFYNWYESTPFGNYHDTDLLVASSNNGNTLIIAFAGTSSVFDTVTNLQTFEPVSHSGLFFDKHNQTLEGSIHRGFLNAYSRVDRGSVLRLCDGANCTITTPLLDRYEHCVPQDSTDSSSSSSSSASASASTSTTSTSSSSSFSSNNKETTSEKETSDEHIVRKKGRRGCKLKNRKLMTVLRELVTQSLANGKSVLLSGHSLGGSLATLLTLDIVLNFPEVPIDKLELWTFGGAQVADDAFLRSALKAAPRLKHFLKEDNLGIPATAAAPSGSSRSRFHRFVTVSDDCRVDFVSEVAQKTLAPANERNIHGKTARKLGGIRGNHVVHLTDPHYLLTPDQYDFSSERRTEPIAYDDDGNEDNSSNNNKKSTTRSTLTAHSTGNYIKGISRESKDHPLSTDLPEEMRDWVGEIGWTTA